MQRVPSSHGVELAVYHLGGDGPPVLFAHATGFHGHVWLPVVEHLRDSFACYSFDERGHGDSTSPDGRHFDWRGFGDDVLATIDHFGLRRPFGVGHSAGGAALLLAELARPGTFTGLWCFEPIVFPADPPLGRNEDNPLSKGAARRREVFPSKEEAYENFASKPPFSTLHPDALRAYVEYGFGDDPEGVRLKCHREDEAEVYRMGSDHDAYARLGQVTCPVHLACGETTDAITPQLLQMQAERLPRAETEVMAGLGHFGPLEDPAAVAASIRRAFTGR